jgi:hypothetical protein
MRHNAPVERFRSTLPEAGTMVFGGHGHDHWHLRTGASYVLERADGGRVQSQTKAGWCFFDQAPYRLTLPGAPTEPVYSHTGCDGRAALSLQMGMSPGWGDPYFWQLEDQEVDITNVADGEYRLWAYADPDGWLRETIEANNATWADVRLTRAPDGLRTVEVLEIAPAP